MKINIVWTLLMIVPYLSEAQQNEAGIRFEKRSDWQKIKAKALKEHKGIFVDCYTTTSEPSKTMDSLVYTNKRVGDLYNSKFVCVKVQMDKTSQDAAEVKNWYKNAALLAASYTIIDYPSFLYFSPEGLCLHKSVGAKSVEEFIQMAADAGDTQKAYYVLLRNYEPGKISSTGLKALAGSFSPFNRAFAIKIAVDYLNRLTLNELVTKENLQFINDYKSEEAVDRTLVNRCMKAGPKNFKSISGLLISLRKNTGVQKKVKAYLDSLSGQQLWENDNLHLLAAFAMVINLNDKFFQVFYEHPGKADSITNIMGLSTAVVDYVVDNKLIQPELLKSDPARQDVNWQSLFETIAKETGTACAERNIIKGKVGFYQSQTANAEKAASDEKRIWGRKYAAAVALQIEKYGYDTTGTLATGFMGNTIEYSIYRYSEDPKVLQQATKWLENIMRYFPGAAFSYVYAGILYKCGNVRAAIDWQEMTVQLIEDNCYRQKKDPMQDGHFKVQLDILNRMKKREKSENIIYWAD